MELQITKYQLPIIETNYEAIKAELGKNLSDYKNLVVTEDNMDMAKKSRKELNDAKAGINRYRIDKKKELSAPITAFEKQCKELESMIDQAKKPIDEAITKFEADSQEKRREEKRVLAEAIIKDKIDEYELEEKYAAKLTMQPEYMQLSSTKKRVVELITIRAEEIRGEQDAEKQKMVSIAEILEEENKDIKRKLSIDEFKDILDKDLYTIIKEIDKRHKMIYEAENGPAEEAVETTVEPFKETKEPVTKSAEAIIEATTFNGTYQATYVITGNVNQLRSVSKFLKENGICYEVTDQEEI